jgi:hypothetical protein
MNCDYGLITDTMDIVKTHKKGKHMNTLQKYTQIIHKQPTHERQCHRAQQPNIQNVSRNKQQIAAQNRQKTKKEQADKHTRKETTKLTKEN